MGRAETLRYKCHWRSGQILGSWESSQGSDPHDPRHPIIVRHEEERNYKDLMLLLTARFSEVAKK